MKSLGCTNAINLDGGGSTVMYVNGQIVNRPQQAGGIALSNALVISKKLQIKIFKFFENYSKYSTLLT